MNKGWRWLMLTGIMLLSPVLVSLQNDMPLGRNSFLLLACCAPVAWTLWQTDHRKIREQHEMNNMEQFSLYLNRIAVRYGTGISLEMLQEEEREKIAEQDLREKLKTMADAMYTAIPVEQGILPDYMYGYYLLCRNELQYGEPEQGAAFSLLLQKWNQELQKELARGRQSQNRYEGVFFLLWLPWAFPAAAASFAITNIPSLKDFYQGGAGSMLLVLILLIYAVIWLVLTNYASWRLERQARPKGLDKIISMGWVRKRLDRFVERHRGYAMKLQRRLNRADSLWNVHHILMFKLLLVNGMTVMILLLSWFTGAVLLLTFIPMLFVLGLMLPDLLMLQRANQRQRKRWHNVLLMELLLEQTAGYDHFSLQSALEQMEQVPGTFSTAISRCRDDLGSGEEDALERLKQTDYIPFGLLAECLVYSDSCGMQEALKMIGTSFTMAGEREEEQMGKKRKTEGLLAAIFAYFPFFLVLGGYFIIPFILESLNQLQSYLELLGTW